MVEAGSSKKSIVETGGGVFCCVSYTGKSSGKMKQKLEWLSLSRHLPQPCHGAATAWKMPQAQREALSGFPWACLGLPGAAVARFAVTSVV